MNIFELNQATFVLLLLAATLATVSSDFSKDKAECQEQLITLSSCLNYVAGEAKAPSPQCCTVLHKKLNVSKKCLCILVKDRNEPSLGLKLNATRALMLPSICHTPSSSLVCIGLLHLDPKSPEARVFVELANSTRVDAVDDSPVSPRTSGGKPRIWHKLRIYDALLLWCLIILSFQLNQ
ncbi:hypothetical protein BVRB_3g068760 [Beta vulgaris subsp. vulgaris]|nr:hypothetical protein BVRB_3g068760 [Beta vulgaris subsp. vulgaris]